MPYMNGQEPAVGDRVQVMHPQVDGGGSWPPVGHEGFVTYVGSGAYVDVDFEVTSDRLLGCRPGDIVNWSCIPDRLDPAGDPAFYLVEPHEGAFRPIPDGPTFSDGKRAADRAKQLSAERGVRIQVRPIAKDIESSGWREREERRLADGTYAPMPRGWDLSPIDGHYLHLAKEDTKMVAFTESPEKGVLDRQTRLTPGRYLERFHGSLSETKRARYVALVDKTERLHFTRSADKIEWVYRNGPHSCMAKDPCRYSSPVHPVRAYAGGDLSLAYLMKPDGSRVSARGLVWREKKIYGRLYGDEARLEKALDAAGYRPGGYDGGQFDGARISKIWDPKAEMYACPYLDGYSAAVDFEPGNKTGHLVIAHGVGPHEQPDRCIVYGSEAGAQRPLRWCPKTRQWSDEPDAFARVNGEAEDWSPSALRAYAGQVDDAETGVPVWYPLSALIHLDGRYQFKEAVKDRYFVSDFSGDAYSNDELHALEDGRKVSKSEFRRHGFTCAGSGRQIVSRSDRHYVGDRSYSVAWMREQADARGIGILEIARRLERGDLDRASPRTPRMPGELRVGDRVRLRCVHGYSGPSVGSEGIIRGTIGSGYMQFLIEFDAPFRGGHDGNGMGEARCENGRGWYVTSADLELTENADQQSIAA